MPEKKKGGVLRVCVCIGNVVKVKNATIKDMRCIINVFIGLSLDNEIICITRYPAPRALTWGGFFFFENKMRPRGQ